VLDPPHRACTVSPSNDSLTSYASAAYCGFMPSRISHIPFVIFIS
jgi:hypothetical protein